MYRCRQVSGLFLFAKLNVVNLHVVRLRFYAATVVRAQITVPFSQDPGLSLPARFQKVQFPGFTLAYQLFQKDVIFPIPKFIRMPR